MEKSKHSGRIDSIDVARGIGIILVVTLHAGMYVLLIANFFNLFHMALFFFLSGYCFSAKKYEGSIGKATLKYVGGGVKHYYLPYVLFNSICILLTNVFISIGFMTDDPRFLECDNSWIGLSNKLTLEEMGNKILDVLKFQGGHQYGGASWFLRSLFIVSMVFFA